MLDDNNLEGDEDLSLCLSAGDDVTVVQGAEKLQVIIEDDEGITAHHYLVTTLTGENHNTHSP